MINFKVITLFNRVTDSCLAPTLFVRLRDSNSLDLFPRVLFVNLPICRNTVPIPQVTCNCWTTRVRFRTNGIKIRCAANYTIVQYFNKHFNYLIAVVIGFEPIIYPSHGAILRVNDNFFIHYKQIIIKSITV